MVPKVPLYFESPVVPDSWSLTLAVSSGIVIASAIQPAKPLKLLNYAVNSLTENGRFGSPIEPFVIFKLLLR